MNIRSITAYGVLVILSVGRILSQEKVIHSTTNKPQPQNSLVIFADAGKDNISRYIYGHFSEHLGRCMYGGIWVVDTEEGLKTW